MEPDKRAVNPVMDKEPSQNKESDGIYEIMQSIEGTLEGDFIKTGPVIKSGSISAEKQQVEYSKKEIPIPVKPVTVRIEDFKKNLNQVVAESELPPFLLEPYLEQMYTTISKFAEIEREQDREAWEKACEEWERACKVKEGEKDG